MFRRTRILSVAGVFAAMLLVAGCAGDDPLAADGGGASEPGAAPEASGAAEATGAATEGGDGDTIVIGSTNFTEQLILAEMYDALLADRGVETETRLNLGEREVVVPALENGEIDLLPEYIGALSAFLGRDAEEPGQDTDAVYDELTRLLPDGIVALEPSPAQDRDALAVTQEFADRYDLQTVSDLANVDEPLVLGAPPEAETRFNGLPGLEQVYGLTPELEVLDAGGPLTFEALQSGQVNVGRVFTTQGQIEELGLVVLEDDQDLIPAENIVPVIREDALTTEIGDVLNELSATLTEEDLISLNKRVDLDNEDPEVVAEDYLTQEGLIGG